MMKALVIHGQNELRLTNVPVPEINADEVLIKMKASGICHSDFDLIRGQYVLPFEYPIIPGHEWCGEIVEIGGNVKNFKVGDRVTGECVIGCGTCPVCRSGQFTYCTFAEHFGFTMHGGDAEYIKARPEWLHKVPDEFDDVFASFVEPFSIGYNSIYQIGGVDSGDTTLILGGGTIGLCALAVAKAMGSRTIMVEPLQYRREKAVELGADHIVNPAVDIVEESVLQLTKGIGADLVIEASGHGDALKHSLDVVKNSGKIAFVGINIGNHIPVELGKIQMKGITARGMVGSPFIWERVINFLLQSKLDLSPILTHQFVLEKGEEAFRFAKDPINQSVKVTLVN